MSPSTKADQCVHPTYPMHGSTGPGNCLGLLASKTSPTGVRGQFYGVAAAVGKLGAFVGTWGALTLIASGVGCALLTDKIVQFSRKLLTVSDIAAC